MRKINSTSQTDLASFDYYLRELNKKREEAGPVIQLELLRVLAKNDGKMRLYALISDYLGGNVTGDDWLDLTEKIKNMQKTGFITIIGTKGADARDLKIKLTDSGKRLLETQDIQPQAF